MNQPRTKIASHIANTTLSKGSSKALARKVAAYLMAEKRVGDLDSLLRDVSATWAEQGYVEVIASSAHPLSASSKAEITKQVKAVYPKAKKVVITEQIDPNVLGGVKLALPNKQLDLSAETKLNKFKQLTSA